MSEPDVTLIAAVSRNGVIGADGKLPWRSPEDLRLFKRYTMGKVVAMGRVTWDSLGRKPLPGRINAVLSKGADESGNSAAMAAFAEASARFGANAPAAAPGPAAPPRPAPPAAVLSFKSPESFLDFFAPANGELCVIGGAQIYGAFMPRARRLRLTRFPFDAQGDAHFPKIDPEQWVRVAAEEREDPKLVSPNGAEADSSGRGVSFVLEVWARAAQAH